MVHDGQAKDVVVFPNALKVDKKQDFHNMKITNGICEIFLSCGTYLDTWEYLLSYCQWQSTCSSLLAPELKGPSRPLSWEGCRLSAPPASLNMAHFSSRLSRLEIERPRGFLHETHNRWRDRKQIWCKVEDEGKEKKKRQQQNMIYNVWSDPKTRVVLI